MTRCQYCIICKFNYCKIYLRLPLIFFYNVDFNLAFEQNKVVSEAVYEFLKESGRFS